MLEKSHLEELEESHQEFLDVIPEGFVYKFVEESLKKTVEVTKRTPAGVLVSITEGLPNGIPEVTIEEIYVKYQEELMEESIDTCTYLEKISFRYSY